MLRSSVGDWAAIKLSSVRSLSTPFKPSVPLDLDCALPPKAMRLQLLPAIRMLLALGICTIAVVQGQSRDGCDTSPCLHGGTCTQRLNDYQNRTYFQCECVPPFYGIFCGESHPSRCECYGDPRCVAFDGSYFNYHSDCRTDMAQACDEGSWPTDVMPSWRVWAEHPKCEEGRDETCVGTIALEISGLTFILNQHALPMVDVNDGSGPQEVFCLPYPWTERAGVCGPAMPDGVPVYIQVDPIYPQRINIMYTVSATEHLLVYMGPHTEGIYLSPALAERLQGNLCGMCGNLNFDRTDNFGGDRRISQPYMDQFIDSATPSGCSADIRAWNGYYDEDYADCDYCAQYGADYYYADDYYYDYCAHEAEDYYDGVFPGAYDMLFCEIYQYRNFWYVEFCDDNCGENTGFAADNRRQPPANRVANHLEAYRAGGEEKLSQEEFKRMLKAQIIEATGERRSLTADNPSCATDDAYWEQVLNKCGVIENFEDGPFAGCFEWNVYRPAMFYNCLIDGCIDWCYIEPHLAGYARHCGSVGFLPDWRTACGYEISCPAGMEYSSCVFRECLPDCDAPDRSCEDERVYSCDEGCVCADGTLWDKKSASCVTADQCGSTSESFPITYAGPGSTAFFYFSFCSVADDDKSVCRKGSICFPIGTILYSSACETEKKFCKCGEKKGKAKWSCPKLQSKKAADDKALCSACLVNAGAAGCENVKFVGGLLTACAQPKKEGKDVLAKSFLTKKTSVKKTINICE